MVYKKHPEVAVLVNLQTKTSSIVHKVMFSIDYDAMKLSKMVIVMYITAVIYICTIYHFVKLSFM